MSKFEYNIINTCKNQEEEIAKLSNELSELKDAYVRFQYILENAISYLKDNDTIDDFIDDRDIDFTEEEKRYFEIC